MMNVRTVVAADALGLAVVAAGWFGTSGRSTVGDQMPWLNLAVAGTFVLASVNALWLWSERQAVARQYRAVTGGRAVDLVSALTSGPTLMRDRHVVPAAMDEPLVAAAAMRWYHRTDCELAAGKQLLTDSRPAHEQAGRRPCGVCRP